MKIILSFSRATMIAKLLILFSLLNIYTKISAEHFDCHPEPNANAERCSKRNCDWCLPSSGNGCVKWCNFPQDYPSYDVTKWTETLFGYEADLVRRSKSPWPNDVQKLKLMVWFETEHRLHFKLTDAENKRYEVPIEMPVPPTIKPPMTDYKVEYSPSPFGLKVTRKSNGAILFDSMIPNAPLIYADQFLQMTSRLSTEMLYGLGENYGPLLINASEARTFYFWARDQFPGEHTNLYGSHPFYINIEPDKKAHGVFLLNSNAMEVEIQPNPTLTYRTIGGVLDFYIFLGPSLENVVQQYVQTIGIPVMPPYWGLGFQLSRWKYNTIENLKRIVDRNRKLGIPYDVQWGDIDYMQNEKIWTYDQQRFHGLPEYIDELHKDDIKYVIIIDPGIADKYPAGSYPTYDEGIKKNIFIKDHTGNRLLQGEVWPGTTVYPDFTHPNTTDWMYEDAAMFHKILPFDGLWIDMNEPSNFVVGSTSGCPNHPLDNPPYIPKIKDRSLVVKTICSSAQQYLSTHYNLHSLYGLYNAIVSEKVLRKLMKKRALLVSRSTYPSLGKYAQHWTGDVGSYWKDLYYSIPGILSFQMFGIPFVGADVCGFYHDSNEELCVRWMQLGSFYPFMRNHNDGDSKDQDPGEWSAAAQQIMKKAVETRYTLLPFMYTQFYLNHLDGSPVVRPLSFVFPHDENVYKIDKQFLWGTSLLISPALEKDQTVVRAYLPRGLWYEYIPDGDKHNVIDSCGSYYDLQTPLEKINIHVRGGAIIPWQQHALTTTKTRKNPINLLVALDASERAAGQLYWDDGESLDPVENKIFTVVKFNADKGVLKSQLEQTGYQPAENEFQLASVKVLGVEAEVKSVKMNGKLLEFSYKDEAKELTILNVNVSLMDELNITWA
ncbi:hypothetical protein HELRODRAFT_186140 [Helobdella robusta]|uniref:P-type domain-containing protein n=1 Tax=Helobdella robusta TaxID=6412 RepID=T1FNQ1_HELRO|nr:hypothetical protein HELRODRAFT_186140 [Helobdella robusta]ESN92523.1 hypothetical protein HELRODRAFT_186140 [Helobdella robusta]